MSRHIIPAGTDIERLRALMTGRVREPAGWVLGNGISQPPTAVEFVPDLTAAEQAALDALLAEGPAAAAARALVLATAQTAAGVAYGNLTAAQVRALLAVLLWQAGALDEAGRVRPLAAWVQA